VEIKAEGSGYTASGASSRVVQELRCRGVLARPLGNVVYMMGSQMTKQETYRHLISSLEEVLDDVKVMLRQDDDSAEACVI